MQPAFKIKSFLREQTLATLNDVQAKQAETELLNKIFTPKRKQIFHYRIHSLRASPEGLQQLLLGATKGDPSAIIDVMGKEKAPARVTIREGREQGVGVVDADRGEAQHQDGDVAPPPQNAPAQRQRRLSRGQAPHDEISQQEGKEEILQKDNASKVEAPSFMLVRKHSEPATLPTLPIQQPGPRRSPDPHPQPKRFVLKFKKQLLEQAQRKEAAEREKIAGLLERQREDAVCVSAFVRERDLEMVPSLEGALSLRSGRAMARSTRVGSVVNGNGVGSTKIVEGESDKRVGRGRGRKGSVVQVQVQVNGVSNHKEPHSNGYASVNEHGPGTGEREEAEAEAVKMPAKPKKMELELRVADSSKAQDKETLERNIDNVIFGDVTFKAWYPSWYPKEIIGEKALTMGAGEKGGIVVTELYVCKRCFGYGKVLVEWVRHCRCCEKEVPGRKVYVHGGWREEVQRGGRSGEWSVWEVDGGVETLFCQNLSLFAKLFLDNKSVFFDVSGFNYFLLVYTPPSSSPHNLSPDSPPTPQIVGFFSKEKMSWDNNNLACILIFPPWQRKGLGVLLMGVSYAIARREGIMGGPEKPISELGRKGYKRFWGTEIARWVLSRPEPRKGKGGKIKREEVAIETMSRETWIAAEDCLGVLRDMGIVERVGRGRVSAGSGDGVDGKGEVKEKVKVKIDKEAVRDWCERERIRLDRVVSEEGFLPGYAEKAEEGDEEEEEEGEVEEEMGD